jgi:molybdenum cofactor cytidylyltransferase
VRIAGVILAAGQAKRMGRPKQLLLYRGTTLIAHALDQALQALEPVVVVVGAYSVEVREAIGVRATVVENPDWQIGLASSIVCGVEYLLNCEGISGALLMAGDQPLVTAVHLRAMCSAFLATETDVVAAQYGGTLGIPAIFGRQAFERLLTLTGDKGARGLLQSGVLWVTPFPLPEAAFDVDTPEDAEKLQNG